jgi:hypothetical protein
MGSSNVKTRSRKLNNQNAIHTFTVSRIHPLTNYNILAFIIISITLFLVFWRYSTKKADLIPKIAEVSTANFNRHFYLWVWAHWDSADFYYNKKKILIDRYGMNQSDFYY